MVKDETNRGDRIFILKNVLIFVMFSGLLFFLGTPRGYAREAVVANFLADTAFGDSRFVSFSNGAPSVITTRFGQLFWGDLPAEPKYRAILEPLQIEGDWFAVEADGKGAYLILASSQARRSLRLYLVDPAKERPAHLLRVIVDDEHLKIDPILEQLEGRWYLTFTQIEGTANRASENTPNGKYTIKMMSSEDLTSWDGPHIIVQKHFNLEDGSLFLDPNTKRLRFLFEQETLDRHNSALHLISSGDFGRTWSDERQLDLLPGDKEPAGLVPVGQQNHLFFSSDAENPGSSYEGFHPYQVAVSYSGEVSNLLRLPQIKGSLLMDVELVGETLHLIGIENYRTKRQLFWYQTPASSAFRKEH